MAGVAWAGQHGPEAGAVHVERFRELGALVAPHPRLQGDVHATALPEEPDRLGVRRHQPREAADLCRHVGEGGPLVRVQIRQGLALVFHHVGEGAALPDEGLGQKVQHQVLGRDAGAQAAVQAHPQRGRHSDADVARHPGRGDVRGAHPEGQAAQGTRVGRVGIRACHHLARQGVAFRHERVADALAARAVRQFAVEADAVARAEGLLGGFQALGHLQQALGPVFLTHAVVQEGEVVAEGEDAARIAQGDIRPQGLLEEAGGHGCYIVVGEAPVGPREEAIPGRHRGQARAARGRVHHGVPGQELLRVGHGPRTGLGQRRDLLSPQPRGVVGEESAPPHDGGGDGIQP